MTQNNNITKLNNEVAKPNNTNLSLKQRLALRDKQPTLLLDVSGSMNEYCEGQTSRIAALRNIVAGLTSTPRIYWFSDGCDACLKDAIPDPKGGTWLARALEVMLDKKLTNILLLTDGEAQDKQAVLNLISAHPELKVQVMYIGPGQTPEFLNQVATGGIATKEDISQQAVLAEKITLLLDAGSPTGSINL